MRAPTLIALGLVLVAGPALARSGGTPFDEETLDRIDVLNEAISDHYSQLQESTGQIEARRAVVRARLETVEAELASIEKERQQLAPRESGGQSSPALRVIEEHRIEAKSRYLEALAEKHALDLEATRAFESHGSGILLNLERLARALEQSGKLEEGGNDALTQRSFHSLQQGTAIALSVLEEWGALNRNDPRFRALYATSRVLNRNVERMQASDGVRMTVELVKERTFVVRSLIDQARALRSALDHQGLLLQVAAQNQMLRLHFNRLGAINGLELPDLDIDDTTRRILEDIEEEPYVVSSSDDDGLGGFDNCLHHGECR